MATATFNQIDSFVEELAHGGHNLGSDQMKIALTTTIPTSSMDTVADLIGEIAYTNLSSRDVTTTTSSQTAGVYKLVLTDLTLTASGGSVAAFRYIVLFNDTSAGDKLICWYDYGASLVLDDTESLTVDFDGLAGALQLQVI